MNHGNSGLAHGTSGSSQLTLDNGDMAAKAKANEEKLSAKQTKPNFDNYPKTIHDGRQGKHIQGHNNYTPGRSKITITKEQLQKLIVVHSNKGKAVSDTKERVDFGTIIGVYVDQSTGKEYPTTIGIINYSKAGTLVVPAHPKGEA